MQTYDEIVESVQKELNATEGKRLMEIRRKAVYDIAGILPEFRERMRHLRNTMAQDDSYETEKNLIELTVNQDTLKKSIRGDFRVNVRIRGNDKGYLSLPRIGTSQPVLYFPSKKCSGNMIWGSDEARKYIIASNRAILDKVRDKRGQARGEHSRKNQIIEDLLANPKAEAFRHLPLLLPAGCSMEIPVAINARGYVNPTGRGHGHIDMLFKTGSDDAPILVIGELKDKRDKKTTPYKALEQAIIYAAALEAEINGLEMDEQKMGKAKRDLYATFFDISESVFDRPIGVAAIIPDHPGTEDGVRKAMEQLAIPEGVYAEVIRY